MPTRSIFEASCRALNPINNEHDASFGGGVGAVHLLKEASFSCLLICVYGFRRGKRKKKTQKNWPKPKWSRWTSYLQQLGSHCHHSSAYLSTSHWKLTMDKSKVESVRKRKRKRERESPPTPHGKRFLLPWQLLWYIPWSVQLVIVEKGSHHGKIKPPNAHNAPPAIMQIVSTEWSTSDGSLSLFVRYQFIILQRERGNG